MPQASLKREPDIYILIDKTLILIGIAIHPNEILKKV